MHVKARRDEEVQGRCDGGGWSSAKGELVGGRLEDVGIDCFESGENSAEEGEEKTRSSGVVVAVCTELILDNFMGTKIWKRTPMPRLA